MKALITGADGFIGSHIVDFMISKGIDVCATVHKDDIKNLAHNKNRIKIVKLDITERETVENIVEEFRPDFIFHMAAQAYVLPSWEDIRGTFETNVFGTLYLFNAVRKANINPVIVVACSSAEYGLTYEGELPIKESKEFRPSSPYAVSKIGADMISYLYARIYDMKIIRVRLFNTVGPRKKGSAIADFAKMIAEIEKGITDKMGVGNLDVTIDITDGRDAAEAMWLLANKGEYGDAYNVCSGTGHKLNDLLNRMIFLSKNKIEVYKDPKKYRPLDDKIFIGDNSKIRKIGWSPKIPIEKTLEDTLEYWRKTT